MRSLVHLHYRENLVCLRDARKDIAIHTKKLTIMNTESVFIIVKDIRIRDRLNIFRFWMPAHGFSCAGIQVHVNLDACTTSIKTAEYLLIRVVMYFYKNKNDDLMYYYQLFWFQIVLMLFHNNYAHFAAFLVSGCLHKRSLCRHPETKDVESILKI